MWENRKNNNCFRPALQKIAHGLFDIHAKASACAKASGKIMSVAIFNCYNPVVRSVAPLFDGIERDIQLLDCQDPGFSAIQLIYAKLAHVPFAKLYLSVKAFGSGQIKAATA